MVDEYVRGPMLWGDNTVTAYTDKIDATGGFEHKVRGGTAGMMQSSSAECLSLGLPVCVIPIRLWLKVQMSKHGIYNENNTTDRYKSYCCLVYDEGYMRKCLVIHNFGVHLPLKCTLTDKIEKAVGVNRGLFRQKKDGDDIMVKLGAYTHCRI